MGNEEYKVNKFYDALEFYEYSLTVYNWLEFKDDDR
eukprot:CAMPEP_0170553136 /NCGR_PEP_ID=MMETSP0211-20121228/10966_1 /TAXON_ID=311385 /ORGANISM="Pseudokeronopsis sp., Strain OXSARD2" /LENGTH=35 /DNA_ID= /DNA_START= /DNA_END= /DNA_ORIENTATION=